METIWTIWTIWLIFLVLCLVGTTLGQISQARMEGLRQRIAEEQAAYLRGVQAWDYRDGEWIPLYEKPVPKKEKKKRFFFF